jgi:hypothetical protein
VLQVSADGSGPAGQAGEILLVPTAAVIALRPALSDGLARWRAPRAVQARSAAEIMGVNNHAIRGSRACTAPGHAGTTTRSLTRLHAAMPS